MMKRGFCDDIEDLTESNEDFRRVIYTGQHLQLVLMTLQPGEEKRYMHHYNVPPFSTGEATSPAIIVRRLRLNSART